MDTFNTGQSKYAAQFTESRKNVASYVQRTVEKEGYLVVQAIRTGEMQTISLPRTVPAGDPNEANLNIIRTEEVRALAKRRTNFNSNLKK